MKHSRKLRIAGGLAFFGCAYLVVSALQFHTACGCGDPRRARIERIAMIAADEWANTGRCPARAELLALADYPATSPPYVILCGESSGSRHLSVIDPGRDGLLGTRDDQVAFR